MESRCLVMFSKASNTGGRCSGCLVEDALNRASDNVSSLNSRPSMMDPDV